MQKRWVVAGCCWALEEGNFAWIRRELALKAAFGGASGAVFFACNQQRTKSKAWCSQFSFGGWIGLLSVTVLSRRLVR